MGASRECQARLHPTLISLALGEGPSGLVFRPEPPGDEGRLHLPRVDVSIDVRADELRCLMEGLAGGALLSEDVRAVLTELFLRAEQPQAEGAPPLRLSADRAPLVPSSAR